MEDNKRKERYEVLYEDMMSKFETLGEQVLALGERMDRFQSEVRKDISEFKSDMMAQFNEQNKMFEHFKDELKTDRRWLLRHDKQLDKHEKMLVNQ